MVYFLIVTIAGLNALGQFLIKRGMNIVGDFSNYSPGQFFWKSFTSPFVISGLFSYAMSVILWLVLFSKAELSFASPMLSLGYIFILLLSYFLLHEPISLLRFMGVILIVGGVFIISKTS